MGIKYSILLNLNRYHSSEVRVLMEKSVFVSTCICGNNDILTSVNPGDSHFLRITYTSTQIPGESPCRKYEKQIQIVR